MCEQLLGYLMGALEPEEQQALEARLKQDPRLRQELDRLRQCLAPLEENEPELPAPGLAERAFHFVMARVGPGEGQFGSSCQWRPQDIAVAGAIMLAAALLVFPAISSSRYQAQTARCQHNLMHLGQALSQYSLAHQDYFPEVPMSGNLSAAGVYAPTLHEAGLIEHEHVICPAAKGFDPNFKIPTLAEVNRAIGAELRAMQQKMGGSYGYSFGYVSNGRYLRLRNRGRSTFALMADAPSSVLASEGTGSEHGPNVQNVLFEDGHVQLMNTLHIDAVSDHIFRNHQGHVAPGIGPDDAVIAPSDTAPMALPLRAMR